MSYSFWTQNKAWMAEIASNQGDAEMNTSIKRYWFSGRLPVRIAYMIFEWPKIRGIQIGPWIIGEIKGEVKTK